MDIRSNNAIDITRSNICRCCLKAGCFKNISEEYYCSGQKEVYGEMLSTTFDIQVSHQGMDLVTYLICDACIAKLREATTFKQMVLQNEEHYLQIIETLKFDQERETKMPGDEVKLEQIKCESPNVMEFGNNSYDDDDDGEFLNSRAASCEESKCQISDAQTK